MTYNVGSLLRLRHYWLHCKACLIETKVEFRAGLIISATARFFPSGFYKREKLALALGLLIRLGSLKLCKLRIARP